MAKQPAGHHFGVDVDILRLDQVLFVDDGFAKKDLPNFAQRLGQFGAKFSAQLSVRIQNSSAKLSQRVLWNVSIVCKMDTLRLAKTIIFNRLLSFDTRGRLYLGWY